jgi:hypothetical protein
LLAGVIWFKCRTAYGLNAEQLMYGLNAEQLMYGLNAEQLMV